MASAGRRCCSPPSQLLTLADQRHEIERRKVPDQVGRARPRFGAIENAFPRLARLRFEETVIARRGRRIGDSEKTADAAIARPAYFAFTNPFVPPGSAHCLFGSSVAV